MNRPALWITALLFLGLGPHAQAGPGLPMRAKPTQALQWVEWQQARTESERADPIELNDEDLFRALDLLFDSFGKLRFTSKSEALTQNRILGGMEWVWRQLIFTSSGAISPLEKRQRLRRLLEKRVGDERILAALLYHSYQPHYGPFDAGKFLAMSPFAREYLVEDLRQNTGDFFAGLASESSDADEEPKAAAVQRAPRPLPSFKRPQAQFASVFPTRNIEALLEVLETLEIFEMVPEIQTLQSQMAPLLAAAPYALDSGCRDTLLRILLLFHRVAQANPRAPGVCVRTLTE